MPISNHDFELGLADDMRGWMRAIHEFLAAEEHREQAYSEAELMENVAIVEEMAPIKLLRPDPETGGDKELPMDSPARIPGVNRKPVFKAALRHLKKVGAIERKPMAGTHYYRYRADLPPLD